jgi:hypothetical protein
MDGLQPGDPVSVSGYRLLGRLGAGGMGRVYLGVSPGGRQVAVKLIHPVHAGTAQFRERFTREIDAARKVGGFHTASVVDADPHADPPWMVTAFIDGPSLQEAIGRDRPLRPGEVRMLAAGLAEGLAAIHAHGLVHRDLKPGNVILAADGPRIIDFGIARAVDATTGITTTGAVVGTFAYMSPEQIRGEVAGTPSDVFSLGCVLAFAATGRPPFGTDAAAAVMFRIVTEVPDLAGLADEDLRELIAGCLAKSPADRPSVPAFLAALTRPGPIHANSRGQRLTIPGSPAHDPQTTHTVLRAPAPGTAVPAKPLHARPPRLRARRRPAVLIAAVAIVALLAALPILLTTSSPRAAGRSPAASNTRAAGDRPSTNPAVNTHIPARNLTLHDPGDGVLSGMAFSPNGSILATAGGLNGPAYLWDVATGKLTATLTDPNGQGPDALAISPDSKLLASADGNDHVYLWDIAARKLITTFASPNAGAPYAVAFSPDGTLLATGEGGNQVDVWDVATGRLSRKILGLVPISGVTFSPDGKLLVRQPHLAL